MKRKRKHKTTVRTGLPQATWRMLNSGLTDSMYSLKDLITMYIDLQSICASTSTNQKEITQTQNILAKHILNATKALRRNK